ncbi:MAG: dihydrodipicolinate synthase family protein [Proteobacteria bacterium]|jgi:4-hydroxy-tetrahydrodipicolinate synthase|nr:dihydrodipicolinate synthase family protein [Candidatus Fonsibacter lacus]
MEKAVYSAVLTPFNKDLSIDKKLFISHCEFLLKNNISLAPLGTTGEANSVSVSEKIDLIKTISSSDLPKEKIIIGTGNTSFVDAALLTKTAVENKIYSVLLLPPFYYKNVSDEGVYQYYKQIINTVKSKNLRVFLYNIPQVSGVTISIDLVNRLKKEFSDTITGIKDSSGNFENTKKYKEIKNFIVYPGSEKFLYDGLHIGCSGCISATTNVNIEATKLINSFDKSDGESINKKIKAVRDVFEKYPVIAALKATKIKEDSNWSNIRPPLVALSDQQKSNLAKDLKDINFS